MNKKILKYSGYLFVLVGGFVGFLSEPAGGVALAQWAVYTCCGVGMLCASARD